MLLGSPALEGSALRAVRGRGAQATLDELAASNLRGRGGAGFPTARKWQACRDAPLAPGHTRVVVCNADEGEPGTFKDRYYLETDPHRFIEGMLIGAHVVEAAEIYIYGDRIAIHSGSLKRRPIRRLMACRVLSGLVTA